MSENGLIQLGLCCLNTTLRAKREPIYSSRSIQLKTLETKGVEFLKEKIIQNLKDTLTLMDWNEDNGIKVFRLSSELFPHMSNSKAPKYDFEFAKDLLIKVGEKSKQLNQRLTFHPGQYNVIGATSKEAFENTIRDLKYHADVLDLMNLDQDSVMVIHGGGTYGDKSATKERWCKQFRELPENVRRRVVLENCEKNFSIEDCLEVSEKVNVPVVFDTHHFECYKLLHKDEEFKPAEYYIPLILKTWERRGIKPKFHVSEQGSGKIGHHSDYIETIPEYLLEIPEKYSIEIDIMIEAKMKELAIFHLYNKYPFLNLKKKDNKILKSKQLKEKGKRIKCDGMLWTKICEEGCLCCV